MIGIESVKRTENEVDRGRKIVSENENEVEVEIENDRGIENGQDRENEKDRDRKIDRRKNGQKVRRRFR